MSDTLLEIKDLNIVYKTDEETVHAVNGIRLRVGTKETLGLVGETGAGKTTTALAIMRLLPDRIGKVEGGEILFDGKNLLELKENEMRGIRGQEIAMIFQDPMTSLNPVLTVEDQILEVRVPMQDVVEMKDGVSRQVQKKMFPGYVLINMVMNDDTWYVVRNTRGVTGFVGPGSKPVPLTDEEMRPLGIHSDSVQIDFAEGDTVVVTGGVWKDTVGVIQAINENKQSVTINVDLFGRETPVEISFTEIKKM